MWLFPIAAAFIMAMPADCSCSTALTQAIAETEHNYSGYADKVTAGNRAAYEALKRRVRAHGATATSVNDCLGAMNEYVAFFRDGHLDVRGPNSVAQNAPQRVMAARRIGADVFYLAVSSFNDSYADVLNRLLGAHRSDLERTRILVIDVRGNGGGSDDNFRRLVQLLYTDPIVRPGTAMYATPANIERWQAIATNPSVPAETRTWLRARVANMRAHSGAFALEAGDTLRLPERLKLPESVAIIVDRGCRSSCEAFILAAQQSRKVTIYGTNTGGVLDYANVLTAPLPACADLSLHYASSRSAALPKRHIDPEGIAPDVRIPSSVHDSITWVTTEMEKRHAHR